jgi:uncharacterized membrane protein
MFDTVNGLPLHPLVVHGVVVLLPLAMLGTIAIAVRPRWRHRFGLLVLGMAAAGTVFIPIATSSGESFEKHVGDPGEHAELGDQLIWFALPMLVLVAVLVFLDRRGRTNGQWPAPGEPTPRSGPITVVSVLAVVASVVVGVQVYRVGESGARAAWGDVVSSASAK